ncbi:hypothetical protein WA026_019770 [Henosepilachna vigintioctopunctata]|uniref:Uncharacterized protein n=1 Tax=Henosepilachna vigintioctopunctata TaxID=420089 RepID=A0AAW1URW3_9CUCU
MGEISKSSVLNEISDDLPSAVLLGIGSIPERATLVLLTHLYLPFPAINVIVGNKLFNAQGSAVVSPDPDYCVHFDQTISRVDKLMVPPDSAYSES